MQTGWTSNQIQAMNKKGKNILVAASAGSGKTAVLVERIINKIINEKVDIDKLLIVTFTNAAASEIRQRILETLYLKIDENPENMDLQRQILLLNKANISTIHSFCLEVIKNYFYEIDLSSNFRIADNPEIELLKQETLDETFENLYKSSDKDFINLINTYCEYKSDEKLKELVLKIYNYVQSMPFPEDWIKENVEKFNVEDKLNQDFSKTIWGRILLQYFFDEIYSCIREMEKLSQELSQEEDLQKYYEFVLAEKKNLEVLSNKSQTWDDLYEYNNSKKISGGSWPKQKETDCELKDKYKKKRDSIVNRVKELIKKIFLCSSEEANKQIFDLYYILKSLEKLILDFTNRYQTNKKDKNILDFNDIEHYALKILVKKDEDGNYVPTDIAKIYQEKFNEIAIDEYQDSNLVQEYILTTISKGNNIFMVGDVKQSIYKFRQARPELFLEKYNNYLLALDNSVNCKENTKIQLLKNFRSRQNILKIINIIFENIMSKKLGDIEYNEEVFLNYGAKFDDKNDILVPGKVELNIIDLLDNEDEQDNKMEEIMLKKDEIEAKFVARRIKDLLDSELNISDKGVHYRKITNKDIVILLRTAVNISSLYEKELNKLGIPVFNDSASNYFETEEIQIILAVLKIIDNPNSDIPLVTVMRSEIGGFTDNELVEIRLKSKNTSYYKALQAVKNSEEGALKEKVVNFLNTLEEWQEKQEYLSLDELIWYIYESTNYYDFVSSSQNGEFKIANLKLLFEKAKDYEKASFKGLYNFINYVDKISKSSGDMGSAKLIGENENVVRIMSIHKSKGLEFPVVFLCGTGRQFNLKDLNQSMLLHQDIGFGPKYKSYERKIEYDTVAREAIRIKGLNEILSEEMRLLYVALTRAKEQLIITGYDKNYNKSILEKEGMVLNNNKLDVVIIRKAKSYLDWIELVYINNKDKLKDILEFKLFNKSDIQGDLEDENEITNLELLNGSNQELIQEVDKILSWEYPYKKSTKMKGKSSVTSIVKGNKKELITITEKPKFLIENEELNKAEIGSLIHLVMQKLDFSKIYNKEEIKKLLEELIDEKIINKNQASYVDIGKILNFTKSDLYLEIRQAKKVQKEKPFYIYISSDEIYHDGTDEKILVQGIIDLYYINKDDKLILVDYKTDYVKNENGQELIDRYKGQLDIYKRALEQSLNKKVEEVYIYSTYLDKTIYIIC